MNFRPRYMNLALDTRGSLGAATEAGFSWARPREAGARRQERRIRKRVRPDLVALGMECIHFSFKTEFFDSSRDQNGAEGSLRGHGARDGGSPAERWRPNFARIKAAPETGAAGPPRRGKPWRRSGRTRGRGWRRTSPDRVGRDGRAAALRP